MEVTRLNVYDFKVIFTGGEFELMKDLAGYYECDVEEVLGKFFKRGMKELSNEVK